MQEQVLDIGFRTSFLRTSFLRRGLVREEPERGQEGNSIHNHPIHARCLVALVEPLRQSRGRGAKAIGRLSSSFPNRTITLSKRKVTQWDESRCNIEEVDGTTMCARAPNRKETCNDAFPSRLQLSGCVHSFIPSSSRCECVLQ